MFFFFFSESECFLEMGLDMKRLFQLGGGAGVESVGPAHCPDSARPPSAGLIQNERIKKSQGTKECKTKQGKMTTFV